MPDRGAKKVSEAGTGGPSWLQIFTSAGFGSEAISSLVHQARRHGTSVHLELSSTGKSNEDRFYRALAFELGMTFREVIDHNNLIIRDEDLLTAVSSAARPKMVFHRTREADNELLICPAYFNLAEMRSYIHRYPSIAERIAVVAPGTLRAALLTRARPLLAERAISRLFEHHPHLSARIVANAAQGFGLGLFAALTLVGLVSHPSHVLVMLHCLFSIGFLSCVLLRMIAAVRAQPPQVDLPISHSPDNLPVYSVLVPLFKESDVVPDLLIALGRLVWPRSKLEIKLILEEDDFDTLQTLQAQELRSNVEVITVPNLGPRTKPKALTYCMPVISGEFVAVYDAEDAPHPAQLLEAWNKFSANDKSLACLQAPLHIRNGNLNMLTRLFAFEYSALFRGLLPELARRNLCFPLGGTSNHFRGLM